MRQPPKGHKGNRDCHMIRNNSILFLLSCVTRTLQCSTLHSITSETRICPLFFLQKQHAPSNGYDRNTDS